jgi:ribosome maturation protein Sdo1
VVTRVSLTVQEPTTNLPIPQTRIENGLEALKVRVQLLQNIVGTISLMLASLGACLLGCCLG